MVGTKSVSDSIKAEEKGKQLAKAITLIFTETKSVSFIEKQVKLLQKVRQILTMLSKGVTVASIA